MDIPVNAESVKSIGLYQSNNQWMIENLKSLSDNLVNDLLTELKNAPGVTGMSSPEGINNNQTETLINTLKSILSGISDETIVSEEATANTDVTASIGDSSSTVSVPLQGQEGYAAGTTTDNLPDINKFNLFKELENLGKDQLNNPKVARMINSALSEALKDVMLMDPKNLGDRDYVED